MIAFVFYALCELLSLLFMYLGFKAKTHKKVYYIISGILLIFIIGARDLSTGVDTKRYYSVFNRYMSGTTTSSDSIWLGSGYFFLFFILKHTIGNNFIFFNFIIASLTVIILYKAILKESKNPTMSLFIFFSTCLFLQMMNQSRQILAIVIVLYSYSFIKEKKLKMFLITIFFASLIHTSAIIMIPFYFIGNFKINLKNAILYSVFGFIVIFGFEYIEKLLLFTSYGKIYIAKNYMVDSGTSSLINLGVRFLLLIYIFAFYKKSKEIDSNRFLLNMSIWTFLFQFITLKIYIFGRITTYFFLFYLFSIPLVLENICNKFNKKFFYFFTVIMFLIYYVIYYKYVSVNSGYDLYKFFFM